MTKLFPYQNEGVKFLQRRRFALLADEMGLGKSAQAIRAAANSNLEHILVVCPACAKVNWSREFKKFGPHLDPVIISYDYLIRHLDEFSNKMWDVLILDEAHFLKEHTSVRTKAVFGKKEKGGLIHITQRTWCLTGTPAPNHVGELWVMLYTSGYCKLSHEGFVARYCNGYKTGRYNALQITGTDTKNIGEVKAMLNKMCLRRNKKEVLKDLPPISHYIHYIEAPQNDPLAKNPELKIKIKEELKRLMEAINFDLEIRDEGMLSALLVLSQSISSLRRYHGMQKIDATAALVHTELIFDVYDKIVIFGIHRDTIKALASKLHLFNPVTYTGDTPQNERQANIDRFQNDPECRIFIGNIRAAGVAINLTAASQVLFIEQEWTPGDNAQAAMRCHRIGQSHDVTVRYVAIADSLDEKITATLKRKVSEIATFI